MILSYHWLYGYGLARCLSLLNGFQRADLVFRKFYLFGRRVFGLGFGGNFFDHFLRSLSLSLILWRVKNVVDDLCFFLPRLLLSQLLLLVFKGVLHRH